MHDSPHENILTRSLNYLEYQAEIYGPDLTLETSGLHAPGPSSSAKPALEDLARDIRACSACGLAKTRTQPVFGSGDPGAKLMLIGEAPGEEEDRRGEPFVGAAGQLLDKILASVGFERSEVFIANILKCRPPGNRDPLPDEAASCIKHLMKQIESIGPSLILALGRIAGQNLLGTQTPLNRLRTDSHSFQGIPVMVTYHPAALLRNPEWKRPVWEDMQRLRRLYDQRVGDKPSWNPPK
jgi:uracil-DNA glycosylase family 4